jgi:hypothetical protein
MKRLVEKPDGERLGHVRALAEHRGNFVSRRIAEIAAEEDGIGERLGDKAPCRLADALIAAFRQHDLQTPAPDPALRLLDHVHGLPLATPRIA